MMRLGALHHIGRLRQLFRQGIRIQNLSAQHTAGLRRTLSTLYPTEMTRSKIAEALCTSDMSLEYIQDLLTQDAKLSLQEQQAAGKFPRKFCLEALELQAADAAKAERVVETERIVDTVNNKTYAMRMDNGKEVIAKALGSTDEAEPATINFARNVLKLPVPDVLDSCQFRGADEPTPMDAVSSAFVIMSKPKGVLLSSIWNDLSGEQQAAMIRSVIKSQKKWTSWNPGGYGSVFMNVQSHLVDSYCRTLPMPVRATDRPPIPEMPEKLVKFDGSSYVLGPVLSRVRKQDRLPYPIWSPFCGPWMTTRGYLDKATGGARPILKRLREPVDWQQNPTLNGFAYQFKSTLQSKLKAIRVYLSLVPRLIANHGDLLKPMLRNPNLRTDSIFVDVQNSSKITGFINWQGSEIVPAYKQIQQPEFHTKSTSEDLTSQQTLDRSSQTIFELFASLENTRRPDITRHLAFRNSLAYTILEQAEDMLTTNSAEFLALVEEYLELHPKYVSTVDDLLVSSPRRWRNPIRKPPQEYIVERLQSYRALDSRGSG